jgi:hypothetical protein
MYTLRHCMSRHYTSRQVVKCGKNINGPTIRIGTNNSYSSEHIERHGVGKPIGTTKITN